MQIDEQLDFGKYEGWSVREIYQGSDRINKNLLKLYLKHRLNCAEIDKDSCAVLLEFMNFEISDTIMRITPLTDDLNGNWTTTIEGFFKDIYNPTDKLIFDIYSLEYVNTKLYSKDKPRIEITSGTPSYVEWAIKNVDRFYFDPYELSELSSLDIYQFMGIEVFHKVEDIYEYCPKIITKKNTFSDELIRLNQEKYEASLKYSSFNDSGYDDYEDWDHSNSDDDYCGGCESSPCRCSDPDPG